MKVIIAAQGRIKSKELRVLIDDYATRIHKYARYEEKEFSDGDEAADKMLRLLHARARLIALEVHGQSTSSEALAKLVERAEGDAVQDLVFVIGGAHGMPAVVRERAHSQISLSAMILPHRLARLVLVEQIYRAYTISRGEPYSHA